MIAIDLDRDHRLRRWRLGMRGYVLLKQSAAGELADNSRFIAWLEQSLLELDPARPDDAELLKWGRLVVDALRREDAGERVDWRRLLTGAVEHPSSFR